MSDFLILNWGRRLTRTGQLTDCSLIIWCLNLHCNGCREKTLFSNGFLLIFNFQSFSKFFSISTASNISLEHQKHDRRTTLHYARELSKCNSLQSQTSTPVERFCKLRWHKLYQQHMSALYTNRDIQTVLLRDSLIPRRSRYKMTWNSFFGKDTLNCGIRGDKVENLLCRAEKLEFPPAIRRLVIHCGTNNIEENTQNDIAIGLLWSALIIEKRNKYIHHWSSTP